MVRHADTRAKVTRTTAKGAINRRIVPLFLRIRCFFDKFPIDPDLPHRVGRQQSQESGEDEARQSADKICRGFSHNRIPFVKNRLGVIRHCAALHSGLCSSGLCSCCYKSRNETKCNDGYCRVWQQDRSRQERCVLKMVLFPCSNTVRQKRTLKIFH